MSKYVMQYRVTLSRAHEWSEWKNLPTTLAFTPAFLPQLFEFRSLYLSEENDPPFVFENHLRNP